MIQVYAIKCFGGWSVFEAHVPCKAGQGNLIATGLTEAQMRKVLKERRLLYCWQGEAGQYEIGSEAWAEVQARGDGLCMLLAGHAGPHVFTPDREIAVVGED